MNGHEINPFQELYVTDNADPKVFVRLFSDLPVQHAQPLFREGNVIIKGTQGSGKSMLLNLFQPQIRLAYAEANVEFPVPKKFRNFVGGGINLRRSGALNIGQRNIGNSNIEVAEQFPLYFADFINYYIVRDVLKSLSVMADKPEPFNNVVAGKYLDSFAEMLSKDDCWFQGIPTCNSFETLCHQLDERIQSYLRFHNYNGELPANVHDSKTSIGEPISKTAQCLKAAEVIPQTTPLFVRIDQVESLCPSDTTDAQLGKQYRRVINKALGTRDLRVSYRVGTRRYAWENDLKIFGREDELENLRDYRIVDLDNNLRRKEDIKTWIFPKFAEDAFVRRLHQAGLKTGNRKNLVGWLFGSSVDSSEAAKQYCNESPVDRILKLDAAWTDVWKEYLRHLFKENPLEAILATAWALQSGGGHHRGKRIEEPPPINDQPWLKPWWKKERIRLCLMQIAARSSQRLKWAGKDQIIALSSGNISIFLSICHDVWEAFLRSERKKDGKDRLDPINDKEPIHPDVQAMGIRTTSDIWYEKISEEPNGDDRKSFITVLGKTFRSWLLADTAMSYPGHNGFSILNDDLRQHPSLAHFLEVAVRHGDLHETPHTTKEKNRRERRKWYLSPIFSPHFQIPESHVKEPLYIKDVRLVAGWLTEAKIVSDELKDFLTTSTSGRSKQDNPGNNTDSSQEQFGFMESLKE